MSADLELYETTWRLARRVAAASEFTPLAFRDKPNDALVAMLTGRELGVGPMQSLRSIHVVEGRAELSPALMRALVVRAGHVIDILESTNEACELQGVRADNGTSMRVTWTLEDAVRARLVGIDPETGQPRARSRSGSPLPWEQYPRRMLLARATSELCSAVFMDVLIGVVAEGDDTDTAAEVEGAAPVYVRPIDVDGTNVREVPACEGGDDGVALDEAEVVDTDTTPVPEPAVPEPEADDTDDGTEPF